MQGGTVEIDGAFVARLTELRDEPGTADFTIVCGTDKYKVHKLLLRLHSKFFDSLFKTDFRVSPPGFKGLPCLC